MSDVVWLDEDELRIFRAFARSSRRLYVQFDYDLQHDVGMPRTYFEILWLLHDAPGRSLRMSELAQATGSQPSRISHAVGRLERAGQVRRELCASDRRGWFTVLTDEGMAALTAAAPRYARSIREHLLAPLSPAQRAALTDIGETVVRQLDRSETPTRAPVPS
ncbi:MAG TPA: MarR family transcriptional regulator [Acidimicrobiales bacterium]|jgi:DNA-binding MarR family transcriptional regulator